MSERTRAGPETKAPGPSGRPYAAASAAPSSVAELAGAAQAAGTGRLDAAAVGRLRGAVGNAAIGRLLAREAAPGELLNPYATPEEQAEQEAMAARHGQELRERVLAPLELRNVHRFLPQLRALSPHDRRLLQDDREFWRRLRRKLSGLSLWTVELLLEHGERLPYDVIQLKVAVSGRRAGEIHSLLIGYPQLKRVIGLRAALQHQFGGRELADLLARLDEPDGARAEADFRTTEVHYEEGALKTYSWRSRFELARTATQLRVIVRIRLYDDPDRPGSAITDPIVDRWRQGITERWNRRFRVRSGTTRLAVWFVPVFVYWVPGAHQEVKVSPGDERSSMRHWYEDDTGGTAAHEFGHMIGNPDEYNLPGSMAEIPASLGLTQEERRRSSYEGITGTPKPVDTEGYDIANIMGSHREDPSVHLRHGWHILHAFNVSTLRRPDEQPFVLERQ